MIRYILISFALIFALHAHAQQIDPGSQVQWPDSCTTGTLYSPDGNACYSSPTLSGNQAWTGNNSFYLINGIPQADQFSGADFCAKLGAASAYAIANGIGTVDATHFTGATQTCTSNPFLSATLGVAEYATTKLTVLLPASTIQITVPWAVTNAGINIIGQGPGQTWIDYTGPDGAPAIISTVGTGSGLYNNQISELSAIGGTGNVTDGILFEDAHHWKLEDVDAWGVTGCGVHTEFAVTPTLIRVRVSGIDASIYGWTGSIPTSGLCFDSIAGDQTTDGTVIDAAAEGTSGPGWHLISANSMTFTSGTSEDNAGGGVELDSPSGKAPSGYNNFISSDFEGNDAFDVEDNGLSNYYRNIIAASAISPNITGNCGYDDFNGGNLVENIGCTGTNYSNRQFGYNMTVPIWASVSNYTEIQHIPFGNTSTQAMGLAWSASGEGEADIWNAYSSGDTVRFYRNSSGGYTIMGTVDGSGDYVAPSGAYFGVGSSTGVTKTCTTYPTVVGGIITSC